MEPAEARKYNIVVFGASGFTGQFVVEEIARTMDSETNFTWAVAGRDMSKLQAVLSTASKVTGNELIDSVVRLVCRILAVVYSMVSINFIL